MIVLCCVRPKGKGRKGRESYSKRRSFDVLGKEFWSARIKPVEGTKNSRGGVTGQGVSETDHW